MPILYVIPSLPTTVDIDGQPCITMPKCQNDSTINFKTQNCPAFANDSSVVTFKNDNVFSNIYLYNIQFLNSEHAY